MIFLPSSPTDSPLNMLQEIGEVVESGRLKNVSIVVNGMDMSAEKYGYCYGYGSDEKKS